MNKKNTIISVSVTLVLMLAAAALLLFKLGRLSIYAEKWAEYDDCGWA